MATKILVYLVMLASASAVPLLRDYDAEDDSYKCARRCSGPRNPKFEYKTSETYVYKYNAEAETSMVGASEDKARMYIETLANIEVIDTCEFALRLQDVRVSHSEPYSDSLKPAERSQEFQTALMENTLRFSFDDGTIRDICHPSQEKIWVLNFKRGLLSSFQNSMVRFRTQQVKEIDVSGECTADYTSNRWSRWSSIKVTKSKNLTACYQHSGFRTFIPMVPYKIASDIQSLPIIKSTHECEQTISTSKILESSICTENHVFRPLSSHQSGGATKIRQTLAFKAVKSGIETSQDYVESRGNLLFQHLNGIDRVPNSREAAEQKLKEICEQTKTDIRPETPRLFTELVQMVKVLDSADVRNLYRMIKSKRLCSENDRSMKFLLDALPIAGTTGAVDLMATVMNGDDLPAIEKDVWLASLSLIPEPSEDMLPSLVKLLSGKSADKALLPVTALLNTMCTKSVNCERSYQFRKIATRIASNIDGSCTSADQSKLMETLRAIGNVGFGDDLLETLNTCLRSADAPLEVKVSAAEAYRRFECQDDEESGPLLQIFESYTVDSELRIMSFLSLMRCPTDSILRKIADQLEREEDVQVANFVFNHLENLKQTSDPHKQGIVEAIEHLNLKKIEDGGFRTSRRYESSALLNRLNLGYVADGDIIWSEASVVPRAMRLNLTVEMFGSSVNLFEAGVRMDGLEKFVKKYFGMEGYLPQNEASPEDLEAFIYARMFGNELFFKHVRGSQEYEKIKSYLDFNKILENLSKDYNFAYTHSQQLLDHSLIIPTIIGLPVNVTVNSTVTVDTRARGSVDLNGILSRSKSIAVSSEIAASAALEVSGSMMVDAQLYKHGLRMRNTLHSSVSMKADLMIKGRQIVNFEIDSPQQRQEIFDARSNFFIIHDNFEKEQEMIKENSQQYESCTGDKFAKVTGLELCGELRYPNATMVDNAPYFPLTGPARASLVLNKKDTHRSYKIFAKWIKNTKKVEAQLQLDTPGAQVDRHISADVTVAVHRNPHVDIVLISPWKKFILNGRATKNDDMASLTGSLAIDDDTQYKLTSELKMNSKARSKVSEYLPFVEVERSGERITLLSGRVVHNEKKNIDMKLDVKDLNKEPYMANGQLVYSPQEKRIEISAGKVDTPYYFKAGSIFKKSGRKNQVIKIDPELIIEYPKGKIVSLKSDGEFHPKPLKIIGNLELKTMRMRKPITLKVNLKQKKHAYPFFTRFDSPIVTGKVNGKVNVGKTSYSSQMKLSYRAGRHTDEITWDGKLQDRSKAKYTHYNVKSNLKFKKMPDYNTASSLEVTRKTTSRVDNNTMDLTIFYGRRAAAEPKNKVIQVSTLFNADWRKAVIKGDLKTKVPEMGVDLKMEVDHLHTPQRLDSEMKFNLASQLENDIVAGFHIQKKGNSLFIVTADGNLEAGGEIFGVKSGLYQKSRKRYEHSLTLTSGEEDQHSLFTVYKNDRENYQIHSTLESTQIPKPWSLDLSSKVQNPSNFHVMGALKQNNKDMYSVDALAKLEGAKDGKLNFEIVHPSRKMTARANFNNVNNRISTKATVNWDVGSNAKPAPEVDVTGLFTKISEPSSLLLKGNVKVTTPFTNLHKLGSNWNLELSESDLKSTGKFAWGGIHKQISTGLNAKLPISIDNAQVFFHAKTPFNDYKDIELELDHTLSSEIKSLLRGKLERDETKLILNGKQGINDNARSIEGDLTLKTPFRSAREIVLSLEHFDDEKEVKSLYKLNKDGQKYTVDLLSTLNNENERSGHINLSGPERTTQTLFAHKVRDGKHLIEASVDSALKNKRRRYNVDISGHYHSVDDLKLNIDVKSPLRSLRKGGLEIGFEREDGSLESKIILTQNRGKFGYDVKLSNKHEEISTNLLLLLSPMYENDIRLTSTVLYSDYPVTVSSEIHLAPYRTIGFQGSYKTESLDDMEVNMRLTSSLDNVKSINVVASNILRNSVRVSHLNIDYALRKMIDIEVSSQNVEEKKSIRLKAHVPSLPFESLDTGFSIDKTRGLSKADLELVMTQGDKYEGIVSLKQSTNDNTRGTLDIKTPIDGYQHIEGNLVSEGRGSGKTHSLLLNVDDVKMVDISVVKKDRRNKLIYNVNAQGSVFEVVVEEYTRFLKESDIDEYIPNVFKKRKQLAKKFTGVITIEQTGEQVQWTVTLIPEFESGAQEVEIKLKQSGESWTDFGIDGSINVNGQILNGKLVVQLVNLNDVKFESMLTSPRDDTSLGISFSLSRDADQLQSEGSVGLLFTKTNYTLCIDGIQKIEFTSTSKGFNRRSQMLKINYTHIGHDNGANCSLRIEDEHGIRASIQLEGQTSPKHLFSLNVTTPFDDYEQLIISGDYDETKVNGLIKLNEDTLLYLSGSHNNFEDPKLSLKTPLRALQDLTIDINGPLSHGDVSYFLKFNDYDQMDGTVATAYVSPSQLEITATSNFKIDGYEHKFIFDYENAVEPRKSTKLLLSHNDLDKIIYSSHVESDFNGNDKVIIDLTMMLPTIIANSSTIVFNVEGNSERATGFVQLQDGSTKTFDVDLVLELLKEKKATFTVREPRAMEYSFTQGNFQNENEIYLNWDKTDPDANVVIGATYKDQSTIYNKLDRSVSLRVSCPSRSIGVEHAIVATSRSLDSTGRLYWNNGFDSQVSYDLTLKDLSNRRQNAYNGELKFKLPTRTLGIAGSSSDLSDQSQAETTFSWDLDNDVTKKIGLKGIFLKGSHTQADISLILPKDAHVDSKLVMNKGNTILEGKTQIFYSDDDRKTLTLFSKLENNPGHSSLFYSSDTKYNYSLELGLSHPDSRIDIKMVSHYGADSERMSAGVVLDYLNSRRQTKNMDLFMEINRLKKEISLTTKCPYKSISMTGAVVSEDPVHYVGSIIVDDEERNAARLVLDRTQKRAKFDWTTYGTTFSYSAFFPNTTALQLQRDQAVDNPEVRDYMVLFQLPSPNVLQTTLHWRRGLTVEARDRFFDDLEIFWRELKELVDDVGVNLKREVENKYTDISSTILEDVKSIVDSVEEELVLLESDFVNLERNLGQSFDLCSVQLGDYVPLEELFRENVQFRPVFADLRRRLQSLSTGLDELKNIPAEEVFADFVKSVEEFEKSVFTTPFWDMFTDLYKVPQEKFDNFWNEVDKHVQKMNPQEALDAINREMERLRNIKLSTLILNILERYEIVSAAKDLLQESFVSEVVTTAIEDLKDSEVYRRANQYGLVEMVPGMTNNLVNITIEVVDEEVRELLDSIWFLRNPITRFDPEQGVLQVEIPLLISLERLDRVPTVQDISDKMYYFVPEDFFPGNSNGIIVDAYLE